KKPDAPAADVQPRAHAVPLFGRSGHAQGVRELEASDARERVGDDRALDVELTWIGNVRVDAPAAPWIAGGGAPVRRRLIHADGLGVRDALRHALDARAHALAGNRA